MARPFWLRFFGMNGPTTLAEFRAALMAAPVGETIGAGRLLANLGVLHNLPAHAPERPTAQTPDLLNGDEHAVLATAVVTAQDLAAAPASTPMPAIDLAALVGDAAVPVAPTDLQDSNAIVGPDGDRDSRLYLNGIVTAPLLDDHPHSPFEHLDLSAPYMLIGDLQTGLVVDPHSRTVLQGGPGDYPELTAGPNDTVELSGDYSAGVGLAIPDFVEQVIARAGNDYNLVADDSNVAAGARLTVNATALGAANNMIFDGSAETDGRFLFLGSESADVFVGGAGDDIIYGHGGADILSGGGGSDTFAYFNADQSSGAGYDVLADFDAAVDKIDLQVNVTGFDDAIQSGTLSAGSFNADLGAALAGLGAGHAAFYAPDAGDLAGQIFLIVDANGVAGYQEGEDYVFALADTTLADLSGHTGFFI